MRTPAAHVLTGFQHAQVDLGHVAAVRDDVLGDDARRRRQRVEVDRGVGAASGRNHLSHELSLDE